MKQPPRFADRLLTWLVAPHQREEVLGDLHERYALRVRQLGETKARRRYWREVVACLRPSIIKRQPNDYPNLSRTGMLRSYLIIALRNLARNRAYSVINIAGLAAGMAVAMLIGLWIYDELSVNTYFRKYDRIAQVMRNRTLNGERDTKLNMPIPLATSLQRDYGITPNGRRTSASPFKQVVLACWTSSHTLSVNNQVLSKSGKFMTPGAPDMLSLTMLKGSWDGLREPASIMLSASAAQALFGDENPLHKSLTIDNSLTVNVTGIYEDIPTGNSFADVQFIAPWSLYAASTPWVKRAEDDWTNTSFEIFVELMPQVTAEAVSATIKDLLAAKSQADPAQKPELLLHPMSRWHLYSEWKNGV